MNNAIEIIEKPDWVSWDEIRDVLWRAHALNRKKGIKMAFPNFTSERIKEMIEGHGKLYIAIVDDKLVGTGAIIKKEKSLWCGTGKYAYFCLASVLSEYNGRGIYTMLRDAREREARKMELEKVLFETHEKNSRVQIINSKNGYKKVDLKVTTTDHYNVYMVKWLNGCPYLDIYCRFQFLIRNYYKKIRFKPGHVKRFGI